MKRNNKIKIGNLLKIRRTGYFSLDSNHCYIGLIVDIDIGNNLQVTIYSAENNKPSVKKYAASELSNLSTVISKAPWKTKKNMNV